MIRSIFSTSFKTQNLKSNFEMFSSSNRVVLVEALGLMAQRCEQLFSACMSF